MNRNQLKAVSDALHNGADAILVWGELAPKHTPLPWKWHVGNGANPRCHIQTVGGFQIASTPEASEHTKANAELICRAVNAHDELVNAAKRVCEAIANCLPPSGTQPIDGLYYKECLAKMDEAASALSAVILKAERAEGKE